jgi:hypothetical protein
LYALRVIDVRTKKEQKCTNEPTARAFVFDGAAVAMRMVRR